MTNRRHNQSLLPREITANNQPQKQPEAKVAISATDFGSSERLCEDNAHGCSPRPVSSDMPRWEEIELLKNLKWNGRLGNSAAFRLARRFCI